LRSIGHQSSLITASVLVLLTMMLVTAPVFADGNNISVHIVKFIYADHGGPKDNLAVMVIVRISCDEQSSGTLTVSLTLVGPDHNPVDLGTGASKSTNTVCGPHIIAFNFLDVLKQSGWYTITATATFNGLSGSGTLTFDPSSDGGHGPPG